MGYKREITLNFPLRRSDNSRNEEDERNDLLEGKERLESFYMLTERLRESEWRQEYLVIYNSYVLENI